MKKVKSKNFILIVFSVLIVFIILISLCRFMLDAVNKIEEDENAGGVNILYKYTKLYLDGTANMYDDAKVFGTKIAKFNVILKKPGDKVQYVIGFCNKDNKDYVFKRNIKGEMNCYSEYGYQKKCNNIEFKTYMVINGDILKKNELLTGKECGELIVEARYLNNVDNGETIVVLKDFYLDFDVKSA